MIEVLCCIYAAYFTPQTYDLDMSFSLFHRFMVYIQMSKYA